jgi:hypothetical protein
VSLSRPPPRVSVTLTRNSFSNGKIDKRALKSLAAEQPQPVQIKAPNAAIATLQRPPTPPTPGEKTTVYLGEARLPGLLSKVSISIGPVPSFVIRFWPALIVPLAALRWIPYVRIATSISSWRK